MQRIQPHTEFAANIVPLLRSIAKEITERSLAILNLESCGKVVDVAEEDPLQVAALANQRRELRHSMKELEDLGWERDRRGPLQFKSRKSGEQETYVWRPEDSYFFKTAEL